MSKERSGLRMEPGRRRENAFYEWSIRRKPDMSKERSGLRMEPGRRRENGRMLYTRCR
ncbi:MAG: hypothetical protein PUG66_07715 [Clostridiales bacterium]|nr:hypothetical protein [Clostridiales bacterium]